MRGAYARQDAKARVNVAGGQQVIKTRKRTHKVMTLNQRLVLEALRALREASVTEMAHEVGRSRDSTKNVVTALVNQGYIKQARKEVRIGSGCLPASYKWSGKTFPPSCELKRAVPIPDSVAFPRIVVPPAPEIEVLVAGINAMVCAGRAAA
jgi:hypothetical protein